MTIALATRRVAAVSLAAMLAVLLGWFLRSEVGSPTVQLDAAIARSRAAIDGCAFAVQPETRNALRIYLAIEDFFRPTHVRAAEFLLARAGALVGVDPVTTVGIGQISRKTYLSVARDGGFTAGEGQGWPDGLRDDCTNIAVLQLYADKHGVSCTGGTVQCVVLLACFWHTGRADSCAERTDDSSYLANLLTTKERISRIDLRRRGSLPVSNPERVGRGPRPRSAASQWEQMQPR
jgi:hypothetical protein